MTLLEKDPQRLKCVICKKMWFWSWIDWFWYIQQHDCLCNNAVCFDEFVGWLNLLVIYSLLIITKFFCDLLITWNPWHHWFGTTVQHVHSMKAVKIPLKEMSPISSPQPSPPQPRWTTELYDVSLCHHVAWDLWRNAEDSHVHVQVRDTVTAYSHWTGISYTAWV